MSLGKRESPTVLITGATGFIGSNLTKQLLKNGSEVHIIKRPHSKLTMLNAVQHSINIHTYDSSTESVFNILNVAKPDIVLHLASLATVTYEPKDILPMIQSNVLFGTQLVEAMIANKIYNFINTGTYSQHYENKEYSPQSLYAATKQAFDDILIYYSETTPLKIITLKLFDSYGPCDPRQKIIPLLLKTFIEKTHLSMSPGEQLIDLVYIDDIVNAYLVAIERLLHGCYEKKEEFAVSSERPIRLKDLVTVFESVTNSNLQIKWGGRSYRIREGMIPWNKGTHLPGWKPVVPIQEGIRRLLEIEGD